ncbi:MAG: sigma 54-interacting transcriptional regulator [Ignavibacteriaceae bacterium]
MSPEHCQSNEILNSLPEGIFSVDKEFKIRFFNSYAEKITGLNCEQVLGKYCKDIFHSKFCNSQCPIVNVLELKKPLYDLETHFKFNGVLKSVRLNTSIINNENSQPVGGVVSFREAIPSIKTEEYLKKNHQFCGIVGLSKSMTDIFNLTVEIADCDASVLIAGETGTGKELIADAIQATSRRKDKPFVKVNCAVLPPALLASELFGHIKGAFTDAVKDRTGRFELADNGTIFLDEIAEMPAQMQLQLLRVIQNGTFEKVGESITRRVDVRVIAATNLNIEKAIKEGKFREDLFFRLNVIPITIPPLRERKTDILFLAKHFLNKFTIAYKKGIEEIEQNALDCLIKYDWPGNVRELENAIEFAFIRTNPHQSISICKLPPAIRENYNCQQIEKDAETKLDDSLKTNEILALLNKYNWNKTQVAREMGINRTTLWRHIKNFGLE